MCPRPEGTGGRGVQSGGARGCSRCHGSGAQKGIGYTVDVPDSLEVKVELEIDDDESSLEIELT